MKSLPEWWSNCHRQRLKYRYPLLKEILLKQMIRGFCKETEK